MKTPTVTIVRVVSVLVVLALIVIGYKPTTQPVDYTAEISTLTWEGAAPGARPLSSLFLDSSPRDYTAEISTLDWGGPLPGTKPLLSLILDDTPRDYAAEITTLDWR